MTTFTTNVKFAPVNHMKDIQKNLRYRKDTSYNRKISLTLSDEEIDFLREKTKEQLNSMYTFDFLSRYTEDIIERKAFYITIKRYSFKVTYTCYYSMPSKTKHGKAIKNKVEFNTLYLPEEIIKQVEKKVLGK